ncbi:MAG: glutamine--fructose-6-phosphate transaminase (isomerizing) [Bradyrhizobiaceae bacterium]|nr:glutamine--fructose-6-phosphate transaminase (isomerizing) [Bradyrhizobiaceae bacterium]
MCGIVGYIGPQEAVPILLTGLHRMEYRGYDSAGLCSVSNGQLIISKRAGRVADLEKVLEPNEHSVKLGIGHTRWATHGLPNDVNAHPHTDASGRIALVHNGIIENYLAIRKQLENAGLQCKSDTDSEVLAVFIGMLYDKLGDLELAVQTALQEVDGTFGLVVVSTVDPDLLIAARRGSPLILGIGKDEYIVASDASAIISHTRQVIYLAENEMAVVRRSGYTTKTIANVATHSEIEEIAFELSQIERGGFAHFMLKEIHEQPSTFHDGYRGRLNIEDGKVRLGGLSKMQDRIREAKRIIITACGTSWHAALVGEYLIEQLARIPVEVEYASEFRYRDPIVNPDDVVIAISQSGETADTLAAVREARRKGATVLGMVNVVGSTIARETDAGVYLHAGPEIGVASTKAFTSQLCVLTQFAMYVGQMHGMSPELSRTIAQHIDALPGQIQEILDRADEMRTIAKQYARSTNALYLGRGVHFPVALEGALKLKEISYVHAEGYPAAEMKHGPIALIDENMPVVFIATKEELYDKVLSGIEEVRARRGKVIAIATEGDEHIKTVADHVFTIPSTLSILSPVLASIPLQLLAYYVAVERGCNVDMPRNLAKSVTVE